MHVGQDKASHNKKDCLDYRDKVTLLQNLHPDTIVNLRGSNHSAIGNTLTLEECAIR